MKKVMFVLVILLSVGTGLVYGTAWTGGGGTDDMWTTTDNWDAGVPHSGIDVFINTTDPLHPALIDSTVTAACNKFRGPGYYSTGGYAEGVLNMTGGTLDIGNSLYMADDVNAVINISGGTITSSSTDNKIGYTGSGLATLNISGTGTMSFGRFLAGNGGLGCVINISGDGQLLETSSSNTYLGYHRSTEMTISGNGYAEFAGSTITGNDDSPFALTINDNGHFKCVGGYLYLGYSSSAQATVNVQLNGGLLETDFVNFAGDGVATMDVLLGIFQVNSNYWQYLIDKALEGYITAYGSSGTGTSTIVQDDAEYIIARIDYTTGDGQLFVIYDRQTGITYVCTAPYPFPIVDAGGDTTIKLPSVATLAGSASDDGGTPDVEWAKVSGSGTVSFDPNAFVVDANASFGGIGDYVLNLEADDGVLISSDQVNIKVLPADYSPIASGLTTMDSYSSQYDERDRGAATMVNGGGFTLDGYFGTHDTGNSGSWLCADGSTIDDQWVVVDLGAMYDLNYIRVWNYNDGDYLDRGVAEMEILVSPDNSAWTSLGTVNLDMGAGDSTVDYSQLLTLSGVGRYVKFNINSAHHGDPTGFVGIAEVMFSGTLIRADISEDGHVDTEDLALLAGEWLNCMDPTVGGCDAPWVSDPCYDNRAVGYIDIPTTMLDSNTTFYTVFQSHNQKVVSNDNGIFLTYTVDELTTYYTNYYLLRSVDGGKSFTQLYTERTKSRTPILETDTDNNVYLMSRYVTTVRYDKFSPPDYGLSASTSFTDSAITHNGGKAAMALDEGRNRIYYMCYQSPYLHILNKDDGSHIDSIELLTDSSNQTRYTYPQFVVDKNGTLHFAWTTERTDGVWIRPSIHYMRSDDGGYSWQKMDDTPLTLPVVWDWSGVVDEITDTDEHDYNTWLSNFMPKDGKLHFMYQYQDDINGWEMRYKRFNAATGVLEIDRTGLSDGEFAINGPDGIFVTDFDDAASPLFIVGHEGVSGSDYDSGRVASLVSPDNGTTWLSYAKTVDDSFLRPNGTTGLYSVGGCRQLSADGYIIGTFAHITENRGGYGDQTAQTLFYKIPTAAPSTCQQARELGYWPDGDIYPDCIVNLKDFAVLAQEWLEY